MKSSRYQLLLAVYGLSLILFFLTRLVLLAVSWHVADPTTGDLLKLFFTGLLYDTCWFSYSLIVPALYLWLAPTLLGLLDMNHRSCFFGRDILHSLVNRALIANYQYLGLYDGNRMAILEPQKKIRVQEGLLDGMVTEHPPAT